MRLCVNLYRNIKHGGTDVATHPVMAPIRNALSAETAATTNVQKETRLIGRKGEKVDSSICQLCLDQTDTAIVSVLGCLLLIVIQLQIRWKTGAHIGRSFFLRPTHFHTVIVSVKLRRAFRRERKSALSHHLEFVDVSICVDMIVDTKVCVLAWFEGNRSV